MQNVFNSSTSFVLLGIVEMEELKYLYCTFSLVIYLFIMCLSTLILFVVLTEESLHEPMYILISNLVLNGIFLSSSFFPKLMNDLLTSSKHISHFGCFLQVLCFTTFAMFEISIFTIMAYDTYVAVCHPLRYTTLMTNEKVMKLIVGALTLNFLIVLIAVLLSARLPLCGTHINNIVCDSMSLVILSCVDTSVNNFYEVITFTVYLIFNGLIIVYSYVRIFVICLKVSKDAYDKAMHTLVTHLLNFSIFMVGVLFVFIRYRLGSVNNSLILHILLSVTPLIFPPLLNPLIYGIRTTALNVKMISYLQKIHMWKLQS
ncbi:olfactory receptor 6K3-like [Rhinophrynus dorsalis]